MNYLISIVLAFVTVYFFLIPLFRMAMNKKNIKRYFNGVVSINGTMGKGKSALSVALAQQFYKIDKRRNGSVYSTNPMKLTKNKYSNVLPYDVLSTFLDEGSHFPFKDYSNLIFDEFGLFINASESKETKPQRISAGFFLKLSRHMFDARILIIEQSPNRLPVNVREKCEWFLRVKKMKVSKWLPFITWDLQLYSNLDDYGTNIFTKRQLKKGATSTIKGEAYNFRFVAWKKKIFNSYDTRAFSVIRDLKYTTHLESIKAHNKLKKNKKSIKKIRETHTALNYEFDALQYEKIGLDKLVQLVSTVPKDVQEQIRKKTKARAKTKTKKSNKSNK